MRCQNKILVALLLVSLSCNVVSLAYLLIHDLPVFESADNYESPLTQEVFNKALVSYSDISSFVDSLPMPRNNANGFLNVLVPPYPCSDCIAISMDAIKDIEMPYNLFVPESRSEDIERMKLGPETTVFEYSVPDSQNPFCYYSDLLVFSYEDGAISDYFLCNAKVPDAMNVFIDKCVGSR